MPKAVNKDKLRAIRLHYATKTTEPTMIEKTMTPLQLFQANSPFWATGLTILHIRRILNLYSEVEVDAFFNYFDDLINEEQYDTARMTLYRQHRKELK